MHTPFQRDITAELLAAFREQGIAPGLYFSPDDFWWLYRNGKTLQRNTADVAPKNNPGLLAHDRAQVKELLSKYGPIDAIFFDGPPEGLRELAWEMQPNIVVTRGAIETPEQYIPGIPLKGTWEANLTMGTAWQYQPQNENYKSGGQLISLLVETRAKGGNLLLNIGPKPDGELPIEQEERLRELALWMFVNSESIYGVRPWVITNEGDYWFTKKKNEDTLYVVVKQKERWQRGTWKDIVLRSVAATPQTEASILGQNDRVLEYRADVVPKTTFSRQPDGLHIRAMHTQRLQDNSRWPNPVVLKLTHVKPALVPPRIATLGAKWDAAIAIATLEGELLDMGKSSALEAGFEYRSIRGLDANERTEPWKPAGTLRRDAPGRFSVAVTGWKTGDVYEFRAFVKHPLLTLYGGERKIAVK
jgi:alpha-L-fucosidase